jgi:anti-sigma factor RsiW
VTEYLEGTLDTREQTRFERHIDGCDACTAYLDQMRETISALGHIPPESLSPEAERELLAAFANWRDASA